MSDSKDQISHDPERDLQHFLRLALAQVRHRIKLAQASATNPQRVGSKTMRLHLLEELLKEQVPNENPSSAAGTPR